MVAKFKISTGQLDGGKGTNYFLCLAVHRRGSHQCCMCARVRVRMGPSSASSSLFAQMSSDHVRASGFAKAPICLIIEFKFTWVRVRLFVFECQREGYFLAARGEVVGMGTAQVVLSPSATG